MVIKDDTLVKKETEPPLLSQRVGRVAPFDLASFKWEEAEKGQTISDVLKGPDTLMMSWKHHL